MALKISGKVTGAPIAAEASPNTTPPNPRRIHTTPLRNGAALNGNLTLWLFLEDGTSLDVVVWVYVGTVWHALNAAATVATKVAQKIADIPAGADIFVQPLNPVGNPTTLDFAWL